MRALTRGGLVTGRSGFGAGPAFLTLRSRRAPPSFTIVELLVVVALIAIILSIGTGIYYRLIRTGAIQAERGAVTALIQSARTTALSEGVETFVCVNPAKNQLFPFGRTRVGVWHFEDLFESRTDGAFGHVALAGGGQPALAEGKVGRAIQLDGTAFLECKMYRSGLPVNIPTYDAAEGVAVEAWVMPTGGNVLAILSRQGWFGVWLEYDPAANLFALAASAVTSTPGGGFVKRSASTAPIIRHGEWTHVSVSCHKLNDTVAFKVNGKEQALAAFAAVAADAPDPNADTTIGGGEAGSDGFRGRIDELVLSAYSVDMVHTVTRRLELEATGLAEGSTIRFDTSGRLAPAHNGSSPTIIIKDRSGNVVTSSVTITVGATGMLDVETWHK